MTKLYQTGFPSRQNVGNCKIEFFNGPTMDKIDPKWIKIFPKKSPKPFLRPNTWSCSAPFDRNNLKSWLLIYVHLKVTFQFQEISPKFDFFFQILCHQKNHNPNPKVQGVKKIRLLKYRFDKSRIYRFWGSKFSPKNYFTKIFL